MINKIIKKFKAKLIMQNFCQMFKIDFNKIFEFTIK